MVHARLHRLKRHVRELFVIASAASALAASAAPALAADIMKGAQVYAMHCASCHGPAGVSVMPNAPHLARGERMMQSDLAVMAAIKAGKNAMPAYVGILNDQQILDVIAYSRTLKR